MQTSLRHSSEQKVWLRIPPPHPSVSLSLISVPVTLSMPTVLGTIGTWATLKPESRAKKLRTPLKMPPPPNSAMLPVITEAEMERLRDQGVLDPEDDPNVLVEPASGRGPRLWFQRVEEPKQQKNRLHLDLRTNNDNEIHRLIESGATDLYRLGTTVTMADPEGNEFCLGRE